MTRIIAGSAKGRRLAVPAAGTRPTSDRVREAMFSTIESELGSAGRTWSQIAVLDLFCGSGALGLEAVSRGAYRALLVEKSRQGAAVASSNVATLGVGDVQVVVRDVRQLIGMPAPEAAFDMCFADPPYDWRAAEVADILSELDGADWFARGALIVVERPSRDPVSPIPRIWPEARRRPYGNTVLWYGQAVPSADVSEAPS